MRSIERAEKKINLIFGLLSLIIALFFLALLISAGLDGVQWFTPGISRSVGFIGMSMPGYMMLLLFNFIWIAAGVPSIYLLWKGL